MFHKLKQYNDLRKQANSLKSKLAEEKTTVSGKGVSITMDGNLEIKEVNIDSEVLSKDKKHTLESAIKENVNEAVKKTQRIMATKMKESGDFNIPGLG